MATFPNPYGGTMRGLENIQAAISGLSEQYAQRKRDERASQLELKQLEIDKARVEAEQEMGLIGAKRQRYIDEMAAYESYADRLERAQEASRRAWETEQQLDIQGKQLDLQGKQLDLAQERDPILTIEDLTNLKEAKPFGGSFGGSIDMHIKMLEAGIPVRKSDLMSGLQSAINQIYPADATEAEAMIYNLNRDIDLAGLAGELPNSEKVMDY